MGGESLIYYKLIGNTGLVGGGVPVFDEIILSSERMNKIHDFDCVSGTVICQSGVILENLGFMIPIDLGAKGSCMIGGNLATNAGGLRLLRYGSLHGSTTGLEVVLPNGQILDNINTLRKDNTGFDLKQLFIGSEGTIGFITKVALSTPKRPLSINVAVLCLESFENIQKAFLMAKTQLSEILSAFEFWDGTANDLVSSHSSRDTFPGMKAPFYVLIETHGSNSQHDCEKLDSYLESLMNEGIVIDGVLAQDESQMKSFWGIREGIPEACSKKGAVYKYDISLPVAVLYDLVVDVKARLKSKGLYNESSGPVTKVIGYGHIGDGNLHLNVTSNGYNDLVSQAIEPFVYEWAKKYKGSISAEHGLGLMKAPYLNYSKSEEMIEWMQKIKHLFDPKGIMNPYKYLPKKNE